MAKASKATGETKRQLIKKSSSAIVGATAIAAIVASFSIVTINFLWNLSRHNESVITEKQKASRTLEENVENIEPLQNSFRILESGDVNSVTVLDALPSKYDFPALATTMESLAIRSGLTLSEFSGNDLEGEAAQQSTTPNPIEIPFTMVVQGEYQDIQEFIDNLGKTIRPLVVKSMELKGSDSSMKASLSIVTYYQPATDLNLTTKVVQ
jgi:Tfp pilus assembly protein PilO